MKKILLLLLISISIVSFSQSCLPDGISFNSQQDIDNFQTNYPGCTEIEGWVMIWGEDDVTNLNGLNVLTSIGGYFRVWDNESLTDITGLNNLTSIGGNLNVRNNNALTTFYGLENLSAVAEDVFIMNNDHLQTLTGLSGLTSVGERLVISDNIELETLDALENLTSIGESLEISYNSILEDLNGLSNLSSVNGIVKVRDNSTLPSLEGLENIPFDQITGLEIYDNTNLSVCDFTNICEFLDALNGHVTIYNNAVGCKNILDLASNCNVDITCLPYGNYCFSEQSDVDNFQSN